ncbi:hypothetical protein K457DRAFT_538093 [Linnemannia elongata AG-77]|uniref:Uncharacterized protein n=1 Tax=Linnemannia elongata AG-77 TaxID=1314771 RepID=A0A197JWL8_9FUNG|nr:hypothetical protein K457DRAFT_538093 [Linnemannia elongata AG-77]
MPPFPPVVLPTLMLFHSMSLSVCLCLLAFQLMSNMSEQGSPFSLSSLLTDSLSFASQSVPVHTIGRLFFFRTPSTPTTTRKTNNKN